MIPFQEFSQHKTVPAWLYQPTPIIGYITLKKVSSSNYFWVFTRVIMSTLHSYIIAAFSILKFKWFNEVLYCGKLYCWTEGSGFLEYCTNRDECGRVECRETRRVRPLLASLCAVCACSLHTSWWTVAANQSILLMAVSPAVFHTVQLLRRLDSK